LAIPVSPSGNLTNSLEQTSDEEAGLLDTPVDSQMAYTQLEISQSVEETAPPHDAISRAILHTLIYYDLFSFPLTVFEIRQFLPIRVDSIDRIDTGLKKLRSLQLVDVHRGYWYLSRRQADVVDRRTRMEEEGKRMWRIARTMGRIMKLVPFVRGIFISGDLCRSVSSKSSDIDYFIVTEPNRLWIVRSLMVLFRRTVLLNKRKYFCVNYFVSSDNLKIRERNSYAACETASLKPLWNQSMYRQFHRENRWIESYFPNFTLPTHHDLGPLACRPSLVQRLFERLVPRQLASRLDRMLMNGTRQYWRRKFPDASDRTMQVSLRCAENESRAHPEDPSHVILHDFNSALDQYGLETR
jgi:hypothetical protein